MSESTENPELDAQLDEIFARAADGPDYLPRIEGTDHKKAEPPEIDPYAYPDDGAELWDSASTHINRLYRRVREQERRLDTDNESIARILGRADETEAEVVRIGNEFELHKDKAAIAYARLAALEASVRGWEVAEALSAIYDRLNALEGRVALCGGIPDAGDPRPVVTIPEGEGPALKRFVTWLTDHYYIISGDDHAAATNNQFTLGLYDVEDVELIGEYLARTRES